MNLGAQQKAQKDRSWHLLGPNDDKPRIGPAPWGIAADFGPHEQAKIEPSHMDQGAFLDVHPAAQPDPAHAAAAIQRVFETALDNLSSLSPQTVVSDRPNESTECSANGATECSHNGAI